MVAGGVEREGRGEGSETALGEAPEKRVGFQVKGGAFAVCVGPCLGEPGYVETRGESVRDGVKSIGLSHTDGGFGRGMGTNSEWCAAW